MSEQRIKPFIKYCGGKTKLLSYIIENLPVTEFKNYFEPFVGGGSVLFEVISKDISYKCDRKYTISDINDNLINCYEVIKSNVEDLITELNKDIYENVSDKYYLGRTRFNEIKFSDNNMLSIEKAALFIYMNKCGYNGMYRENSQGIYNIPFGKMKNPKICDIQTLTNVSNYLKNVHIACCEYQYILDLIEKDDFVYLDPPYDDTFTDYTNNKFGQDEQKLLKIFIDKLTIKGVYVMLSNSATDFIKNLYKDYKQINLTTKYSLGGKGADRGNKQELLIVNY
jgi:DNA adenine methylase